MFKVFCFCIFGSGEQEPFFHTLLFGDKVAYLPNNEIMGHVTANQHLSKNGQITKN